MKFLGRTQTLDKLPIETCLKKLKQAGFDGVELCLEHPDISPDKLSPKRLRELAKFAKGRGLKHNSVSYHADYIRDDEKLKELLKVIEITNEFDTNILVIGGTKKQNNDLDEWTQMIQKTRELVRAAEENNVIIAKEFEPDFIVGNSGDLMWMLQQIGSDNLKANLDLGHVFLCDPDPIYSILNMKEKIAHCHIEDMAEGIHKHLVPGQGDINFSANFAALKEIGFDGMLGLDLYDIDYLEAAPEALALLREKIEG